MRKSNKNLTIDDLAIMVQRGFENTATKQDLKELRQELTGKIDGVNRRLDAMADYNRRIARLERMVERLTAA
jgi:hypothetical protein